MQNFSYFAYLMIKNEIQIARNTGNWLGMIFALSISVKLCEGIK